MIKILFQEEDFNQKNVRFQEKKPSIKLKLLKTSFYVFESLIQLIISICPFFAWSYPIVCGFVQKAMF